MAIEASTNRAMTGPAAVNLEKRLSLPSCIETDDTLEAPHFLKVDSGGTRQGVNRTDAERALQLLATDEVELVWQPVRDVRDDGILYHEALIRFPAEAGWDTAPARHLAAVERSGLAQAFDREIVGRVIETLQADRSAVLVSTSRRKAPIPAAGGRMFRRSCVQCPR